MGEGILMSSLYLARPNLRMHRKLLTRFKQGKGAKSHASCNDEGLWLPACAALVKGQSRMKMYGWEFLGKACGEGSRNKSSYLLGKEVKGPLV